MLFIKSALLCDIIKDFFCDISALGLQKMTHFYTLTNTKI